MTIPRLLQTASQFEKEIGSSKWEDISLTKRYTDVTSKISSDVKISLKGDMRTNMLGSDGSFISYSSTTGLGDGWKSAFAYGKITVEKSTKYQGNLTKVTALSNETTTNRGIYTDKRFNLKAGKKYLLITDVDRTTGTNAYVGLHVYTPASERLVGLTKSSYKVMYVKYSPTQDTPDVSINLYNMAPSGSSAWVSFDGVGLYEITDDLYNKIDVSIDQNNIRDYFPHFDGIRGVDSPYLINKYDNMVPSFYEWLLTNSPKINNDYELEYQTLAGTNHRVEIPVVPNQEYSFSVESSITGSYSKITFVKSDGSTLTGAMTLENETGITGSMYKKRIVFTTPTDTSTIKIEISGDLTNPNSQMVKFRNPMLIKGNLDPVFMPQQKSFVGFQTELFSELVTRQFADEIVMKDNQFYKLSQWRKVELTGELNWALHSRFSSDFAEVRVEGLCKDAVANTKNMVRYDGGLMNKYGAPSVTRAFYDDLDPNVRYNLYMTIPNADSGWGPTYQPSSDDIKAYFNGWVMTVQDSWNSNLVPYDGSGTKGWVRRWVNSSSGKLSTLPSSIGKLIDGSGVTSLPTEVSERWNPYRLIYRLQNPILETIRYEGKLMLKEGSNNITVGTGIVIKESANPYWNTGIGYAGINAPLSPNYPRSGLVNRVEKIMEIYRNGNKDNLWRVNLDPTDGNGGGKELLDIPSDKYENGASYTVTYLKLEKSIPVELSIRYEASIRAILNDLVEDVNGLSFRDSEFKNQIKTAIQGEAQRVEVLSYIWKGGESGYGAIVPFKRAFKNPPKVFTAALPFGTQTAYQVLVGSITTTSFNIGASVLKAGSTYVTNSVASGTGIPVGMRFDFLVIGE